MSPLFIMEIFSKAKVENVVNPPQNPVAKSRVCGELSCSFFIAYPKIKPKIKHPIIFDNRVEIGNLEKLKKDI